MKEFDELVSTMRRLRRECLWDMKQTHDSLKKHLVEEAYEALDAIDRGNFENLKDELGDVALQVVFHALIAQEEEEFTIQEVFVAVNEKLIRRHPHIYGDAVVNSEAEQSTLWDKVKMSEGRSSVLEGIPIQYPALMKAAKVQKKASKVGFDLNSEGDVWKALRLKIDELQDAVASGKKEQVQKEFGDVLFALVNCSRFIGVDPEESLLTAVNSFTQRFTDVEKRLRGRGKNIQEASPAEIDELWNEVREKL